MDAKTFAQSVQQVYQARDQKLAALRPNGKPYLLPDEEQRRREQFEEEARQKISQLVEEARSQADIREALMMIKLAPLRMNPLLRLSPLDRQQAAALAPFIKEDVQRATYPELHERLKYAASDVERVLLTRYIGHRLADEERATYEAGERPERPWYELSQAVEAMATSLVPEEDRKQLAELERREGELLLLRQEADQAEQWNAPNARADFAARFGFQEAQVKSPYEEAV